MEPFLLSSVKGGPQSSGCYQLRMRGAHMWGMHIAMMGFRTRLSSEYPTGTHGSLLDHLYFQTNMFRICSSINLHDVPEHPVHFVPVSSQLYTYGKIHIQGSFNNITS